MAVTVLRRAVAETLDGKMSLSTNLPWSLANPKWASEINPILALPILKGNQIDSIVLVANKPSAINHKLQRLPQGWFLVDNKASATIWRAAAYTTTTITLEASANTTISIWVY